MKYKKFKIINDEKHYECTQCKSFLPISDFYKDKRVAIGIKSECKNCHIKTLKKTQDPINLQNLKRKWMRTSNYSKRPHVIKKRRKMSKIYNNTPKAIARRILNHAVRSGKLIKPSNCSFCKMSDFKINGHHYDYSKPLDIIWLCSQCHGELERNIKPLFY